MPRLCAPGSITLYPLLKRYCWHHRPLLSLYYNNVPMESERFTIAYNAGVANVVAAAATESFDVGMSATKESPLFLNKVTRIKLYRYPDGDRCGYTLPARAMACFSGEVDSAG